MAFKVLIEKKALRFLNNLEAEHRERVKAAMLKLNDPFLNRLDIKKLKGHKNKFRLRVGDYRILFEIEKDTVRIFDIFHRGTGYG
ncbi:MAG: type II toxin-antitoxin system RelE/ParE family toxin [Candidatus Hydrothermarchaeota archaeon]|nr:type II toxin-antitoxin system RelE/ParE family toxin [Candidatus Hydrothermarchaeota archaeon]